MKHYIEGARSGKGDDMRPAFHDDATIFGYIGNDLFSGPIQKLYDWNDKNGPAVDISCEFKSIEIVVTKFKTKTTTLFFFLKLTKTGKLLIKYFIYTRK